MSDDWASIDQVTQDVGSVYAACRRLDLPGTFSLRDGEVVPIASMYKVLLALEVAEAFERGDLHPDTRCRVTAQDHSPGGAGLNQFSHPVTLSLEDLLYLSLALSDNTAADLLMEHVGLDALHARADALDLTTVHIVGDCRTLLGNAGEDLGYHSTAAAVDANWTPTTDAADLTLERTTRCSTADLARLAGLVAHEKAARPQACRLVHTLMQRQVWTTRFAGSFPRSAWILASKTGTLSPWRGEFGVVTRNDGARLAIAVVIRQHHTSTPADITDRAVGAVARSMARLALREGGAEVLPAAPTAM